jgi:predicted homoserine dehydrogenase-like protein
MEVSADQLKRVVQGQHGGTAKRVTKLRVKEVFEGKTVWEGIVHIFDLEGHSKATRAYAWSSPIEGSAKRRFYAPLHLGGIKSPLDAVRAAIVGEQRSGR